MFIFEYFCILFASTFPSEKIYLFWLYNAFVEIEFLKFKSEREDKYFYFPLGGSDLKSDLKLEIRDFAPWIFGWFI